MTSLSCSSFHSDQTFCQFEELSIGKSKSVSGGCDDGLPIGTSRLESQVAGHPFDAKKNTIGMLRGSYGRVLKPIVKPTIGEREITFYENLQDTRDSTLLELRKYVPKYYGTVELNMYGKRVKFLALKDITVGMAEPCVMDVKIGERTWDPLASAEKRKSEESKYVDSKRSYGFCIPGFHVYNLSNGDLNKFEKDYGKRLNGQTTIEALRIFLNGQAGKAPCRQLIVKLLSSLWEILLFFRNQKKLRFYSSSLLLAYDARRLRQCVEQESNNTNNIYKYDTLAGCHRTRSFSSLTTNNILSNATDGTKKPSNTHIFTSLIKSNKNKALERVRGLKRSISLNSGCEATLDNKSTTLDNRLNCNDKDQSRTQAKNVLNRSVSYGANLKTDKLCRTHSFSNNFDEEIVRMKQDYKTLLSELNCSSEERQNWVRVNMIDFTHVFPDDHHDQTLDTNYLRGIENLVKLVETFLVQENT